jgi:hypothetical protein
MAGSYNIFKSPLLILVKLLAVTDTVAVEAVVVTVPKVTIGPSWALMLIVILMSRIEIMVVKVFIILYFMLLIFKHLF